MSGFRIPFSKIYYLLFLLLVAIFRMILALLQDFSFWISFHSFEHSAFYNSQSFQDLCRYFFHMFGFSVSWPSVLQRFLPWTCLSPLLLRSYPRLFHQQTMYWLYVLDFKHPTLSTTSFICSSLLLLSQLWERYMTET